MEIFRKLIDRMAGGTPKIYIGPPTFWGLEDLRKAISPAVGLEEHLDQFTVAGKINIGGTKTDYSISHVKSNSSWRMYVTSSSPEARTMIEEAIKDVVGGRRITRDEERFIETGGREQVPTGYIVDGVGRYQTKLKKAYFVDGRIQPVFMDVRDSLYRKAEEAKLKLKEFR